MQLTSSTGEFSQHQRYVLTTLLDTLCIPHEHDQIGSVLLWPDNEVAGTVTTEVDASPLSSAFATLARVEEFETDDRDRIGRFSFAQSQFAPEFNCPVDETLDQLAQTISDAIRSQGQGMRADPWHRPSPWPDGAPFAVCLTHDIDWTRKWSPRGVMGNLGLDGLRILRNPLDPGGWRGFGSDVRSWLQGENPFWNLEEIAAREKEFGVRSTFFFLAGGRHPRDGDYSIEDPIIYGQMERLLADGFEIGLHGSYLTLERPELLAEELDRLQSKVGRVWGIRHHFLRFDAQASLKAHEELKLKYDTTMGFADHEGFRAGFSFPYYPYCLAEERPFRVLEIPLTVMDTTLQQYRGLDADQAWAAVERQLKIVKRSGGCCTLLWHNTFFDDAKFPGYGEVYWQALSWIANHGGWATTAKEIWEWWAMRTSPR